MNRREIWERVAVRAASEMMATTDPRNTEARNAAEIARAAGELADLMVAEHVTRFPPGEPTPPRNKKSE